MEMLIEIHGLNMTIHGMNKDDVAMLCNSFLGLRFEAFTTIKEYNRDQYFELRYKFPDEVAQESVYIKFKDKKTSSMTIVNLKGSFFDNSPDFQLSKMLAWLSSFDWTPKQLDVAYVDNEKSLSIDRIITWCENKNKYCTGSLFRDRPKIMRAEKEFEAIRLAKATSSTNYGTIYVRPDTGYIRIEIKFRNKDKIMYLLGSYNEIKVNKFNKRSLRLLTGCIDFLTSKSKKTKVPDQYVRQRAWHQFLGSDIEKISWKKIVKIRQNQRQISDVVRLNRVVKRTASSVKNMIERLSTEHAEDDIFDKFAEHSGYRLVKTQISLELNDDELEDIIGLQINTL